MSTTDRDPSPPESDVGPSPSVEKVEPDMPSFEPLFTLLTNSTTNTTVHPRIHYLFSDDDHSILSTPVQDPSQRALVVDLAPAPEGSASRWAVSWASSLTPDFAVTESSVAVQQSEGDETGGAMLRVEGVEREPVEARPDSLPGSGSGAIGGEDVDVLAEDFKRRMGVLKKVVDEGERRRAAMGQQEETQPIVDDGVAPDEAVIDSEEDKGKGKAKAEDD
ncbi:hypothetical protein NW752_012226 [Fusarium irregulare]|uniref:Uncharacterized protein n=1 Tax=Fusarium irregulare TaxID=2494466 RepID=A0A9W8PEQ5_9HYPO|nr:hypothetical protein NW752_012226 [Fusarium irregulare]KAJ4004318.1 hypothetical protein NW766_011622 [Fusarium irregulare]